jgi:hypothetical protein
MLLKNTFLKLQCNVIKIRIYTSKFDVKSFINNNNERQDAFSFRNWGLGFTADDENPPSLFAA